MKKREYNTKYESWMCDKLVDVAEQGGHVAQMCKAIGIRSRDTFYRWLQQYPEFKDAYEASKLESQSFYENLLLAGALGKIEKFNFPSIAMILNNKFGDDYKRSGTGGSNTEITIGAINTIEAMTEDQLSNKIKSLQKKLDLVPLIEDNQDDNEILQD